MQLHIQKYLRNGGTLQSIEDKYYIYSKRHSNFNNLVLFKYDQIYSPFAEEIVREARGIILDENNDWNIVNFSMKKFFNYSEGHASKIDWNTAKCLCKEDGSLMQLYSFNNEWHIATSGTPDAKTPINDYGFSFEELFWNTFGDKSKLPSPDCGKCFWFELVSQYNRIVVRYNNPELILLGGRDLTTLQELTLEEAGKYFPHIRPVKSFPLQSVEQIVATFEHISPLSQEGFVVCDNNFNRIKVKSPAYIALHHLKDNLVSKRNLVEVVRSGEIDEVVSAFPEYSTILFEIKSKLNELISSLEKTYEEIKDIKIQKEFALIAITTPCSGALFTLRANKTPSIRAFIKDMRIDNLCEILGY